MITMNVSLSDNLLRIKFPYNPKMITEIKKFPSRKWDPLYKHWEVPDNKDNIERLQKLGFDLSDVIIKHGRNDVNKKLENAAYKISVNEKYPFLYKHQKECVIKALTEKNLLVADDMGVGKTLEALAIADYLICNNNMRVVIVCPATIKEQWWNEAEKWFDMDYHTMYGTKAKRKLTYHIPYIIISYEQMRNDYKDIITNNTLLIFDEASYLKNEKAQRTIIANRLAKKCKRVLALTGTPIETKLMDGFNIANLIQPNWMMKNEFYNRYCVFGINEAGFNYLLDYKNVDEFMEQLKSISIRRMKEDIKDMPGKIIENRIIPLSKQQQKITKLIKKSLADYDTIPIEEYVVMPIMENGLCLLSQSKSMLARKHKGAYVLEASNKVKELVAITEELSDKKIVIFTRFKKMIPFIAEKLDKCLIGSGDTKDKIGLIKEFKESDNRFLIVTDAFSYGVNIPFATALINFDIPWNHAKMKQREDRIYRITSTKKVIIINLIADGFEQYIYDRMMNGKHMADRFDVLSAIKEYLK